MSKPSATFAQETSRMTVSHDLVYSIAPFRHPRGLLHGAKDTAGYRRNLCSFGGGEALSKEPVLSDV